MTLTVTREQFIEAVNAGINRANLGLRAPDAATKLREYAAEATEAATGAFRLSDGTSCPLRACGLYTGDGNERTGASCWRIAPKDGSQFYSGYDGALLRMVGYTTKVVVA